VTRYGIVPLASIIKRMCIVSVRSNWHTPEYYVVNDTVDTYPAEQLLPVCPEGADVDED
jgi:hypothetical protein